MARIISISDCILDHYAALEVREAKALHFNLVLAFFFFFLPDNIKIDLSWLVKYILEST